MVCVCWLCVCLCLFVFFLCVCVFMYVHGMCMLVVCVTVVFKPTGLVCPVHSVVFGLSGTHQSQDLSSLSKTQLDLRFENSNPCLTTGQQLPSRSLKQYILYAAQFVRDPLTDCSIPGVKMSSWDNPLGQSHSTHLMSAGELLSISNKPVESRMLEL